MARRKHTAGDDGPVDERELARRLDAMTIGFTVPAVDGALPPDRERVRVTLGQFLTSLDRRGVALQDQLDAVERWLDDRGLLERALRHVEAAEQGRERWQSWKTNR